MYLDTREWETTRGDAVIKAGLMRDAKIVSLQKQIARLRKLKF